MPVIPSPPRGLVVVASFGITLWLLSWLAAILIPIALAILFTFLLSPLVTILQRRQLARVAAVVLVVIASFCIVAGTAWLIARQVTDLVDTYPQFEQNLNAKLEVLQNSQGGFIDKLQLMQERLARQLQKKKYPPVADPGTQPLPVTVIEDSSPFQLSRLWSILGPAVEPFAAAGLTVVLLIFMLIRREDLRDRAISLVGRGRLTLTTKALDEAGERISRYLLTQLGINGGYGIAVAVGLLLIGVPYALLWGSIAAVLRYIPYLGAWLAALLPLGLAVLTSQTWTMPLLVVGWFLVLELATNMVVEPMLYGKGTGVSETATLVMVAFWAWLWGPIGLVLAAPLTVCLVVLGKYVPALSFFDTLLGDQPAIEPPLGHYQRLLARDQDEASDIAQEHFKGHSLVQTFDALLVPALVWAKLDLERAALTQDDQRFVIAAIRDTVEDLAMPREKAKPIAGALIGDDVADNAVRLRVLGCAAQDSTDEAALLMMKELLTTNCYDVSLMSSASLAAEVAEHADKVQAEVICIAAVPPGGIAQARLLCLRLRTRSPQVKILVGRWGMTGDAEKVRDQLRAAGADEVATTLEDTVAQLAALRQWLGGAPSLPEPVLEDRGNPEASPTEPNTA